MPHHEKVSLSGKVADIFAHRFVLETKDGERLLADLGPRGAEQVKLASGEAITLEGERHPSEIKVTRLTRGRERFAIDQPAPKPPGAGPKDIADPQAALQALAATGVKPVGPPRRRPHHFEITAEEGGERFEYHVHDDGHIHRAKKGHPHH